jgi:uncharacterized protein with HEPN domain
MDRDAPHVLDIAVSARLVGTYLEGTTRDDFMSNVQPQDSVIRRLEIIGEAAGRVSAQFRDRHAAIPWSRMIGMRNRVIHGYDAVDLDIVWTTAHERIPELLALIEPLVPPDADIAPESGK